MPMHDGPFGFSQVCINYHDWALTGDDPQRVLDSSHNIGRNGRERAALDDSETLTPFRQWLNARGGIEHSWDDVKVETDPWAP